MQKLNLFKTQTNKKRTKLTPTCNVLDPVYLLCLFQSVVIKSQGRLLFLFFCGQEKGRIDFCPMNTVKSPTWKQLGKR